MTLRRRSTKRSSRDEHGGILVIAPIGLVVGMIMASLAIDLGSLAQVARRTQKVADLAALDAVRALPGVADQTAAGSVTQAAKDSAKRNNKVNNTNTDWSGPGYSLVVKWNDPVTGLFTNLVPPGPLTTKVQVEAAAPHKNQFPFVPAGPGTVSRKGVATLGNGTGCFYPDICEQTPGTPIGTVRVGSTLASVSTPQATVLNRLLTNTVGGTYTVNGVGWQGIASGNVSLSRLRSALGYSVGTPDAALNATLHFRDLLNATVAALNADGSPSSLAAVTPLATIQSQVTASAGLTFTLKQLFDIVGNVGSGKDVADAAINVMDIVRGGLVLADADHFAQFDLLASSNDLPLLQTALPNFVSARVKFGLIQAPQEKSGPPKDSSGTYRTIASTSQIRLEVVVTMSLNVIGVGLFNIDVPYYFAAGSAQAELDTINCAAGADTPTSVLIRALTQPVTASIGTVGGNLSNTSTVPSPGVATLTDTSLAGVTGLIHVKVDTTAVASTTVNAANTLLTFNPPFTTTAASQNVAGTQITSVPTLGAGALNTVVTVAGIVSVSLQTSVTTAVVNAVIAAAAPLVNNLYSPMAKALGLSIGGADVWAPPPQHCTPTSFTTGPTSVGPLTPNGYQIPALVG